MKTLKIMVCALFILCGGLIFAACGKTADFDVSKISISSIDEFTYDGKSHAVSVAYQGVNVNVSYALSEDKGNFKSLNQLATKDAGTYNVYYKLSAKGYNDYISSGTLKFTVHPRPFEVFINDYVWVKNDQIEDLNFGYTTGGLVPTDDVGLEFQISDNFNPETAQYGEEYDIVCSITNPNYELVAPEVSLVVKDVVDLCDNQGNTIGYYKGIKDALENAQPGHVLVLNQNVAIDETIIIDKDITIDGRGQHSIIASQVYFNATYQDEEVASMFSLTKNDAGLKLKDITLDCSKTVRGISAFAGNVAIDNATILNGKKTDKWRSGGVFITNSATFNMTSGNIVGNYASDEEYTKYCADLWIGANAQGLINSSITGGVVGSVFVNSNSYSSSNDDDYVQFTVNGGTIENIYVEYDAGFGATFEYVTGKINNLMVSMKNDKGNYWGVYQKLTPIEGRIYRGGQLVYTEDELNIDNEKSVHYEGDGISNIDALLIDGNSYIFENCTFTGLVASNKHVEIVFNDCEFLGADGTVNLKLSSVESLVVNNCLFEGTTNGIALDIALIDTTCDKVVITNNIINSTSNIEQNVAISIKTIKSYSQTQVGGRLGHAEIGGNTFTETNNVIYIGDVPQGSNTSANTYSGDFDVLVAKNLTDLTVFNRFKDTLNAEEPSVEEVLKGHIYDSTNVD